MSTLFKDIYSKAYISELAAALRKADPKFDTKGFEKAVLDSNWKNLELKQRMRHISTMLHRFLPYSYKKQIALLEKVAPQFGGFQSIVFPDFVEAFGLDDFETSMAALEYFTPFSTSEFAVRPFITRYEKQAMREVMRWTKSKNEHVRRLASEGSRPRLPWGMALVSFKKDPSPVLPVLEALKNDPSEYVRRSVANNLNDIAKDHPELFLSIAKKWQGNNRETDRIVKHASRTLLKRAHPEALALFGYEDKAKAQVDKLKLSAKKIMLGEELTFRFEVSHPQKVPQKLRIEYAVYFMKANGKSSKKVFHITENTFEGGKTHTYERRHPFRDFTTRKHYAGEHVIAIIVNGKELAQAKLILQR